MWADQYHLWSIYLRAFCSSPSLRCTRRRPWPWCPLWCSPTTRPGPAHGRKPARACSTFSGRCSWHHRGGPFM